MVEVAQPADSLLLAFAPLHKRALGLAVGIVFGCAVFCATAVIILSNRAPFAPNLGLLSQFFVGYSVTWPGAVVGLLWGGVLGYLSGWCFAFLRNLILASYFLYLRANVEMKQYRNFIAHI
jgi:hypothetical protein